MPKYSFSFCRKSFRTELIFLKRLSNELKKAEQKHDNHCGNKIDKIFYEVYPAYKKAVVSGAIAEKKKDEAFEDLESCLSIETP